MENVQSFAKDKKKIRWRWTDRRKLAMTLNNLKRDPLEIQHPKFENSRRGVTESTASKV